MAKIILSNTVYTDATHHGSLFDDGEVYVTRQKGRTRSQWGFDKEDFLKFAEMIASLKAAAEKTEVE